MGDIVRTWLEKLPGPFQSNSVHSPIKIQSATPPRLFALLIGINFYEYVASLRCAVADALNVKKYLEQSLRVPSDQIRTLVNDSASRSAIIDALKDFQKDSRIQYGDPILIFFAGHGAEIPGTTAGSGAKMQSLVPQDFCSKEGHEVPSIPDRTFGALIDLIAEAKGDNITVILDCCHAASGTRGNEDVRVRSIEIEPTMKVTELDTDIPDVAARSLAITPGFVRRGLRSHILLAACSATERAVESNEHGCFTSALLKLFSTTPPNEITYQDVLSRIDSIPGQNPQCEGVHQSRYLFNGKVSKPVREFYTVDFREGQFILNAGAIHGIARGAEFEIYRDEQAIDGAPLGAFLVEMLGPFSAILKVRPGDTSSIPQQAAIAVQTKVGEREDLRLFIPIGDEYLPCHNAWLSLMQPGNGYTYNITLLENPDTAHVELVMKNERVVFLYRDERITQYGLQQAYFDVEPTTEEVARVLKALAHYFWKINLTSNNPEITKSIQFEFYQLDPSDDIYDEDTGLPEMTPIPPNICKDNLIDFVIDEDAPYGIKITNSSPHDFYPYLFYFDNTEYYQPPTSGPYTPDVPLKANGGSLTIGYGSGGISPFSYFLRDRQNVDVGFLKLFVSTKRIDLSVMTQPSPFGETGRDLPNDSKNADEAWGTVLLPVIQRRYPPTPETHCVQCGSLTAKSLEVRHLETVHTLETRIRELNAELVILRQSSMDDKRRFEEQIHSLKSKLDELEKAGKETGGHERRIQAAEVDSTTSIAKFRNAIFSLFKRIKKIRLRRLLR